MRTIWPYILRSACFLQSDIGLGSLPIMPPVLLLMVFCSGTFPAAFFGIKPHVPINCSTEGVFIYYFVHTIHF